MSYDITQELKSITLKDGRDINLYGGSYNPGNQPEYNKDYEHYHIEVINSFNGNTISNDKFDDKEKAIDEFKKYLEGDKNGKPYGEPIGKEDACRYCGYPEKECDCNEK